MRTPQLLALIHLLALSAGPLEARTLPIQSPEFLESTDACTKKLDRSAELVVGNFAVTFTDIGGGLSDVQVSATITNTAAGSYQYANALADFSGTALSVAAYPQPTPIIFGDLNSYAVSVPSATPMTLRLPTSEVASLQFLLASGFIPFRVEARERVIWKPGVYVIPWTAHEDALAATNPAGIPIWYLESDPPFGIPEIPDPDDRV